MGLRLNRQWVWGKDFPNVCPAPQPHHGPAQNYWPSLVPGTYLGTTASDRTVPALFSACSDPSGMMGNCLRRVSVERNPQPLPLPLLLSVCPSCLYTSFLSSSPLIPSFFFLFPSYPSLLCSPLLSSFAFQSVPSRSPTFPFSPALLITLPLLSYDSALPLAPESPCVVHYPHCIQLLQPACSPASVFPLFFFPPLSPQFLGDSEGN